MAQHIAVGTPGGRFACPLCSQRLRVVAKVHLEVDPKNGMAAEILVGPRYDLHCLGGHWLGGDYHLAPSPHDIAAAVEAAAGMATLEQYPGLAEQD